MTRPKTAATITSLLAISTAIAACGGSPAAPVQTATPAAAFAPLVHIHRSESIPPMGAQGFISRAALRWASDGCSDETLAVGRHSGDPPSYAPILRLSRLSGAQPYAVRPMDKGSCSPSRRIDRRYTTAQHTRPFDRAGRPAGLDSGDGFYLDLRQDALPKPQPPRQRGGQAVLRPTPAYFETIRETVDGEPGARIVYWMLFAAHLPPGPYDVGYLVGHEGDWERVDVLVQRIDRNRWRPISVAYHANDAVQELPWNEVEKAGGPDGSHPVVYLARGSHSPHPAPGTHVRRLSGQGRTAVTREPAAACRACPRWRTWEKLIAARSEPWYGFGGAWGYAQRGSPNSGPLGPSRYKLAGLEAPSAQPLQ